MCLGHVTCNTNLDRSDLDRSGNAGSYHSTDTETDDKWPILGTLVAKLSVYKSPVAGESAVSLGHRPSSFAYDQIRSRVDVAPKREKGTGSCFLLGRRSGVSPIDQLQNGIKRPDVNSFIEI